LVWLQRIFDSIWDGDDLSQLSARGHWLLLNILDEARKISNDLYEQNNDVSNGDVWMIQLITLAWDVEKLLKDYTDEDD
jgi:hypothetical protein